MTTCSFKRTQHALIASALTTFVSLSAAHAAEPGHARISDAVVSGVQEAAATVVRGNFADDVCCDAEFVCDDFGEWWHGESLKYNNRNRHTSWLIKRWWKGQTRSYLARNRANTRTLNGSLKCKFGSIIPTGCGGGGCPPIGAYERVYAVDPHYADARDGNVYASQVTGVPMAVPLAPNVHHTYNYGWGVPSSRLTPISHIVP